MISIGQVIRGKYRLLRLLGDGGMGAVYEATHEVLGTRVAIKVLHADLARRTGLVDRFLQEARVSAQIQSAHVVRVIDVDRTDDGVAYIVMELLDGEPLSALLDRQGKVPVATACEYTMQILSALEAAHALGVVHRDLKPENVFLTFAAARPVLKLIDFGIAKLKATDPGQKNLTVAGALMGTAEYMAPEQAYGADRVDARSDLYAVGVMLFEMLAGQRPVAGDDARVIALKVERGEVIPLVHVVPEVPRELAGLVHRAMAARPELRFASATEMRLALEGTLAGKRVPTLQLRASPDALGGVRGTLQGAEGSAASRAHAAVDASRAANGFGASHTVRPPPGAARAAASSQVGTSVERRVDTPAPTTERGGPPPVFAMGAGHPVAPAPAFAPPGAAIFPHQAVAPKRRRGTPLWLLVLLPLLMGAGVVVFLVVHAERDAGNGSPPSPLTPASPAPAIVAPSPPPGAVTDNAAPADSIAPLTPAGRAARSSPPAPPARPIPSGPRGSGSAPAASSSGPRAPDAPPFTFPTAFPSGFPFPLPSGAASSSGPTFPFPVPSGFPTAFPFPIPGTPAPAPTAPGAAPVAPPSAPTAAPGKAL